MTKAPKLSKAALRKIEREEQELTWTVWRALKRLRAGRSVSFRRYGDRKSVLESALGAVVARLDGKRLRRSATGSLSMKAKRSTKPAKAGAR